MRILHITLGLICLLAFTPSLAQADSFNEQNFVAKFSSANFGDVVTVSANKYFEQVTCLTDSAFSLVLEKPAEDVPYLLGMPTSSGRNVGFSIAAVRRGPSIGLVRPGSTVAVTQNPEPATVLLLGTGLSALGAFAGNRAKRRRNQQ